jgi:hypothetical protein
MLAMAAHNEKTAKWMSLAVFVPCSGGAGGNYKIAASLYTTRFSPRARASCSPIRSPVRWVLGLADAIAFLRLLDRRNQCCSCVAPQSQHVTGSALELRHSHLTGRGSRSGSPPRMNWFPLIGEPLGGGGHSVFSAHRVAQLVACYERVEDRDLDQTEQSWKKTKLWA